MIWLGRQGNRGKLWKKSKRGGISTNNEKSIFHNCRIGRAIPIYNIWVHQKTKLPRKGKRVKLKR